MDTVTRWFPGSFPYCPDCCYGLICVDASVEHIAQCRRCHKIFFWGKALDSLQAKTPKNAERPPCLDADSYERRSTDLCTECDP
jgi:hypothetical protein